MTQTCSNELSDYQNVCPGELTIRGFQQTFPITVRLTLPSDHEDSEDGKIKVVTLQKLVRHEVVSCLSGGETMYVSPAYTKMIYYTPIHKDAFYETTFDLLHECKKNNSSWLVVTYEFYHGGKTFPVGSILKLRKSRRFSCRRRKRIYVRLYPNNVRCSLPLNIKGNFMKCGSPDLYVKRNLREVITTETFPFFIRLAGRPDTKSNVNMFAQKISKSELYISCGMSSQNKREIVIFSRLYPETTVFLPDDPHIDELDSIELDSIRAACINDYVHKERTFYLKLFYEKIGIATRRRFQNHATSNDTNKESYDADDEYEVCETSVDGMNTIGNISAPCQDDYLNPVDALDSFGEEVDNEFSFQVSEENVAEDSDPAHDTDEEYNRYFDQTTDTEPYTSLGTAYVRMDSDSDADQYENMERINVNRYTSKDSGHLMPKKPVYNDIVPFQKINSVEEDKMTEPLQQTTTPPKVKPKPKSSIRDIKNKELTSVENSIKTNPMPIQYPLLKDCTESSNVNSVTTPHMKTNNNDINYSRKMKSDVDDSEKEQSYDMPEIIHPSSTNTDKSLISCSVEEAARVLEINGLQHYKCTFLQEQIDGDLLLDLDVKSFVEIGLTKFEASKLYAYIHGWRPCVEKNSTLLDQDSVDVSQLSVTGLYDLLQKCKFQELSKFLSQQNIDGELFCQLVRDDVMTSLEEDHEITLKSFHLLKLKKIALESYLPKY